jgi:hypothetical protein
LISLFIEKNFREDYSISTILFFCFITFYFDMVTLAVFHYFILL